MMQKIKLQYIAVAPRKRRMSRNAVLLLPFCDLPVAPRKRRMSRIQHPYFRSLASVAPRKRRVSRGTETTAEIS